MTTTAPQHAALVLMNWEPDATGDYCHAASNAWLLAPRRLVPDDTRLRTNDHWTLNMVGFQLVRHLDPLALAIYHANLTLTHQTP